MGANELVALLAQDLSQVIVQHGAALRVVNLIRARLFLNLIFAALALDLDLI